jgi:hypothetical protein
MNVEHATAFLEATARSSGLAFVPETLKTAATELAASVERDASGAFSFTPEGYATAYRIEGGETVNIPVGEHVATLIRRHAKAAAPKAQAQAETPQTSTPVTPPSRDPWAAFGRGLAAKHDAIMIRETEQMANPWLSGQINRTNQAIITNKNPDLAARFKKEAGQ